MSILENFQAMLAGGRDDALLRYSLGSELLKLKRHVEAAEHLRQAVGFDPGFSAAWKLLGKALAGAGEHRQALEAFDQGIAVAEAKGDIQAAREMRVFRKRAVKALGEETN